MYQGNIAIAKNIKTAEYTYIQKLKGEKNKFIFYDILNKIEVPNSLIHEDENQINSLKPKQYLVIREIPLYEVIDKIEYKNALPSNAEEYLKKIEIKKLEDLKEKTIQDKSEYKNQIQNLISKIGENENLISKIDKAIESNDLSQFYHSYVYAYHPNDCSQREFCWEDKQNLDLLPGEEIEVDTCYGAKKVIVTRVEKSIDKRNNIKEVIGRV